MNINKFIPPGHPAGVPSYSGQWNILGDEGRICYYCKVCILLTKRKVKMAGYCPSFLCVFLWTKTKSRSIKTKKRMRPISSYLDQTSLINRGFIMWHSTPSCLFVFLLLLFVAKCILETHQHFCCPNWAVSPHLA